MILKPRHNACFYLTYLILGLLPMNFILGTTEISEKKFITEMNAMSYKNKSIIFYRIRKLIQFQALLYLSKNILVKSKRISTNIDHVRYRTLYI